MKNLILISIGFYLTLEASAQKCDRPQEVFIQVKYMDSAVIANCYGKVETHIFIENSNEQFIKISETRPVREAD